MRSELFWDLKFLSGIQSLKLGRSDDDDDAKQIGFFCYGSSRDLSSFEIQNLLEIKIS